MRVLYVSLEYPPETGWGGIGTYMRTMATALARRGHDVHVLSVGGEPPARDYLDDGVHVHRRPRPYPRTLSRAWNLLHVSKTATRLWVAASVQKAFADLTQQFDVIELPDWFSEGLLLARKRPAAIVAQLHMPLRLLGPWSGIRRTPDFAVASYMESLPLHRADAVVSPTRFLAAEASRMFRLNHRRITVIPHPVEIPAPLPPLAGQAPPRVLFVGRLQPLKNPLVILLAARSVLRQVPNAEFVFVGATEGDHGTLMAAKARELGIADAVRFLDQCTPLEVNRLRADARVCVVPSWYESFSYVVVEAMAAGRPVVASHVGGIPEIVEEGVHGFLARPDDVGRWSQALVSLLTDAPLATQMGRQARASVIARFHPERIAQVKEALYRSVTAA